MKKIVLALALVFLVSGSGFSDVELRRIRIENTSGGLIQVNLGKGTPYQTVGRVRHPAQTRILGFAAASYTPSSAVAAIAVHGLRIKVGQEVNAIGKAGLPLIISVVPVEFQVIPERYGGHLPRSSGINTDIHAGCSIFRNLAPYAGNKVYLEEKGRLKPVPDGYLPKDNDVFVIAVTAPENPLLSAEFENHAGGDVSVTYVDGKTETIAKVVRPVGGVGRYDGTTFNGVGSINTNHSGVITISTAPRSSFDTVEGSEPETRGGFMIQPVYHVTEQDEKKPQVMSIAADDSAEPLLEGKPPLFAGNIPLTFYEDNPDASCRVEIKLDNGDWETLPKIVGRVDNAFSPEYLTKLLERKIEKGVTSIRFVVPKTDPEQNAKTLAQVVAEYNRYLVEKGVKSVSGRVKIRADKVRDGELAIFYVNGNKVFSSNVYPYEYTWDTTTVPDGMHRVEIESDGTVEVQRIFVLNNRK